MAYFRSLLVLILSFSSVAEARTDTSVADFLNDTLYRSHEGRDIPLIQFENLDGTVSAPKHRVLIQAGLHGDELLAIDFAFWLANRIEENKSPINDLRTKSVGFDIIPVANPDGFRRVDRLNYRDVNLNRNFSVLWGMSKEEPGKEAFSESETKTTQAMFKKRNYFAAVDVHGYINWLVLPSEAKYLKNAPESLTRKREVLSSVLSETKTDLPGKYELKSAGGLGDGGAFEDWAFWDQGVYAFCLELSSRSRLDYPKISGKLTRKDLFINYELFLFNSLKSLIEKS